MTDSFVTQCPHCQTSFRVTHHQLGVARGVVQRDFTFTPFVVAACFYLLMTLVLTWGFQSLEKKYAKYDA